MGKIRVSIDLQATPQRVWQVVEPVERHVDWMADAVAIRFIGEQTRDVGTTFFCDTKVGPIKLVDRMEITDIVVGTVDARMADGKLKANGSRLGVLAGAWRARR